MRRVVLDTNVLVASLLQPAGRCGRLLDLVVDGAAVGANLGVNPSLTITALAERAMSFIPKHQGQAAPPSTQA